MSAKAKYVVGNLVMETETTKVFIFNDESAALVALNNLKNNFDKQLVDRCACLCYVESEYSGLQISGRLYNQVCGE